jgi:hypothetical protein
MTFRLVSLKEYCPTLTYEFKIKNLRDTGLIDILIISFQGEYRYGSGGSPDAGFIKGIIKTGVSVFDPFSVLIDFTDLEYSWGDNFDLSFEEVESIKMVVVVGNKCRKGMSTLRFGMEATRDIVDNVFFFDNFEKAINILKKENS